MSDVTTRILFIAWDSPGVSYLEGLFVPIFETLIKRFGYQFHVIQFSWADEKRKSFLNSYCKSKGVKYTHFPVTLTPVVPIGKYLTLIRGIRFLKEYIHEENIDILMPRSTMPAKMVLALLKENSSLQVIFDADGLPIEERVDFAGLKPGGFRYHQLKKIEREIVLMAKLVITRTETAARFLQNQYSVDDSKFRLVKNGSDATIFRFSFEERVKRRKELGIPEMGTVLVYSGSLGPQYGVDQMLYIYKSLLTLRKNFYFLILTNNPGYILSKITSPLENVIVKQVAHEDISGYLSAADVAFAIRKATFSMQGVAPIKIGEYLLTGLPVVASANIGDSNTVLSNKPFVFLLEDYNKSNLDKAAAWIAQAPIPEELRSEARKFAMENFTVEQSGVSYHTAIQSIL